MAFLWHINFHTFGNKPVFENLEYEAFVRNAILDIAREKEIPILEFEMMPTHVHLITIEFPDFPRAKMMQPLERGKLAEIFR
jgi:REP element-mobilizing transposase RayT